MGGLTFALLLVKNVWEVWVDTDVVERAGDLLMLLALLFSSTGSGGTLARRSCPRRWG